MSATVSYSKFHTSFTPGSVFSCMWHPQESHPGRPSSSSPAPATAGDDGRPRGPSDGPHGDAPLASDRHHRATLRSPGDASDRSLETVMEYDRGTSHRGAAGLRCPVLIATAATSHVRRHVKDMHEIVGDRSGESLVRVPGQGTCFPRCGA